MRVLVTGAQGFVGRHLVPQLEESGHRVTATDRELDITSLAVLSEGVRTIRPEAVVHLAAQSSVAASWDDPRATFRLNYVGSLNLLHAVAQEAPGARVLLIGSSDIYGSDPASEERPIAETQPPQPESPYARSKASAEALGLQAAALGHDVVSVRAFTHIGAGQSEAFMASSFARQVAELEAGRREPLLRVGNLASVRDVLDVRDVVRAYEALLEPRVPSGVYNVASGRGVQVREILDALLELAGVEATIEVDAERFRPTDYRIGDATKLREATGWEPRIPLRETLTGLLDYWREHLSRETG